MIEFHYSDLIEQYYCHSVTNLAYIVSIDLCLSRASVEVFPQHAKEHELH